jgi:hypothetical protein
MLWASKIPSKKICKLVIGWEAPHQIRNYSVNPYRIMRNYRKNSYYMVLRTSFSLSVGCVLRTAVIVIIAVADAARIGTWCVPQISGD